ncbi:MAG TPA: LapA family protein [Firmicutes bacterium]|jgi:uncharacterized integral membrane protein|nr:LapA family protein [Bacillota bacterium]
MQILILLTLVFSLLVAVFALQNAYPVTVHFLAWKFEASLALVILFSVLAGALLFGFFGLAHQARAKISSWQFGKKKKTASKGTSVQLIPESAEEARTASGNPATEDGGEKNEEEKVEDSGSNRRIFPGDR